jgi:hypothetical protein
MDKKEHINTISGILDDFEKGKELTIRGIRFVLTCPMFPEQYEAFDNKNKRVAYVNLRYGYLTCDYCPNVFRKTLYSEFTISGGTFYNAKERCFHLKKIAKCIKREIMLEKIISLFKEIKATII